MSSLTWCLLLGIGVVSAGNGNSSSDDFSNGLFNYIAPLLPLIGDQLAHQYLSQRLGFLENIIFACLPLGILTTVTSAIRVAGPVALRALIGRSQEPTSRIELELLRSTSNDVCELWDGKQVVRTLGSPNATELVYDKDGCIHRRDDVMELRPHYTMFSSRFFLFWNKRQPSDIELSELKQSFSQSSDAPNLFLNANVTYGPEVQLIALIALATQLGVLIFDIASFNDAELHGLLKTSDKPNNGLYFTIAGTIAVSIGVFICCCVIENRTRKACWIAKEKHAGVRIVWLQKAQSSIGQTFSSYAIFAGKRRNEIIVSRLDHRRNLGFWTLLGTMLTTTGFICQLIGLRTMPYQAAAAHTVSILAMTILRLVAGRHSLSWLSHGSNQWTGGSSNAPVIFNLDKGDELNELAKILTQCKGWRVITEDPWDHDDLLRDHETNSMAGKVLQNRIRLGEICGSSELIPTFAERVGETIDGIMNFIWATRVQNLDDMGQFHWNITALATGNECFSTKLDILIVRSGDKWRVHRSTIEAILDLWMSQLGRPGLQDVRNNLWLMQFDSEEECDFFQAFFSLLNPTGRQLEPVTNLSEYCKQYQIGHGRTLCAEKLGTSRTSKERAIIGQSDLRSMCAQYLIMTFLSQMATYIQGSVVPMHLENDSKSGVIRVKDHLLDSFRSILQLSGLSSEEDSYKIIFCALYHTRKLAEPLPLLPRLVRAASLQREDDSRRTCSIISQIVKWNAISVANKGQLIEAGELCLSVIGAFTEVFGYQKEQTCSIRRTVQDLVLDIESGKYKTEAVARDFYHEFEKRSNLEIPAEQILVDVSDDFLVNEKRVFVNSNANSFELPPKYQLHDEYNRQLRITPKDKALDEETLKDAISANDMDTVRTGLLFDCAEYPKFLYNGIIAAFDGLQEKCTFERSEIIRLLVLSGSGFDFGYLFNVSNFLDFAARTGNIRLGEVLLQKIEQNHYQVDLYKAIYTAIEYGQEEFVKFLTESDESIVANNKRCTNALFHAARYGRENTVKYLMSLGASIQGNHNDRDNALSQAASRNHNSLGRFLIQQELAISKEAGFRYQRGETSLHFVARTGNMDLVQKLLDARWDVNAGEREVPLKDAVRYGHEDVANLLIRRGSRADEGLLHQAAEKGLISTAELLISVGADVNSIDRQKRPVFEAARNGPKDKYESCVRLLIKRDARVDVKDSTGTSVLLQASSSGNEIVSMLLVEAGAPLTEKRADGTTVIHSSAKHGHLEVVRMLVKKRVELDVRDGNMRTALNFAAGSNHAEIISILLEAKSENWIDGNSVDEYKQPPLHDAIEGGHLEAARLLVENGASIASHDFVNWRYSCPLYIAVRNQKAEIVRMFMEVGGGGTLRDSAFGEIVKEAVERGHLATISAILSKETAHPIPGKLSQATQHLPHAALRCKIEVVRLLLELGADVSDNKALDECIRCSDNPNFNNWKEWYEISKILFLHNPAAGAPLLPFLLRAAASRNNVDGARFWLSHDAPVQMRYEDDKTILHYAAASDAVECMSILLEISPCRELVNAQSRLGATALHAAVSGVKMYAPSESHLIVIRMLVEHGADLSLRSMNGGSRNEEGITALEAAREANLGLIVKFLERSENRQ